MPARSIDREAPYAPWEDFLESFMAAWRRNADGQAEHVTLVGPNGTGKTTLALRLLEERVRVYDSSVVIFGTKPRDQTLSAFSRRSGWPIERKWEPRYGVDQLVFWPPYGDPETATTRQKEALRPVLREIFRQGNRTVYFDEAKRFADDLGLGRLMIEYWTQGRSNNLLVVAGTQRPRKVPREMFSECKWFLAFKVSDLDELRRVGEIGSVDSGLIRSLMAQLEPHEFLAVRTQTGEMVRSKMRGVR